MNREYQYKPLITVTHKNPLSKNIKFNKDVIDVVNTMSCYSFKINTKLFDIVTSREYSLNYGSVKEYSRF